MIIYIRIISTLLLCILVSQAIHCQELPVHTIKVVDKNTTQSLAGAHISINNTHTITNNQGYFKYIISPDLTFNISITHIGYKPYNKTIENKSIPELIALEADHSALEEIIITSSNPKRELQKNTLSKITIDKHFLNENKENSLMQTLEVLPGVSTISIGSGQSKPVIRGLGFNRVVVTENGIKHESQQWGVDHGLEIDQHNVERIEITKGASSLLYGSDAIAGIISLNTYKQLEPNSFMGEINFTNRINNDLLGSSLSITKRYSKWQFTTRTTYQDFGDYKVPTEKIYYENYVFDLHNNYLRNTAGYNFNNSVGLTYISDTFSSDTYISNVSSKNGFFANAHGLEVRISDIDYDSKNRDVDLPYHKVNHFKITNNSKLNISNHKLSIELGYQNNHREEHTEPTEHGYMPKPNNSMERLFKKSTYSFNFKDTYNKFEKHKFVGGVSTEYQNNIIGGWGFLIPEYNRFTGGAFLYNHYKMSDRFNIESGLRYDYGKINTSAYYEPFLTPVTDSNGNTTQINTQRAEKKELHFGSYSFSIGASYLTKKISSKLNIGKSFRIPMANELASNGVNYHMYRFEEGNTNLKPENSYQMDGEFGFDSKYITIVINPFANYFSNYIYLNPEPFYYETLQKYKYTQSKVFRYGGEIMVNYNPTHKIFTSASLEYVKSKQLSGSKKNFTLPFSPPLSSIISIKYLLKDWSLFSDTNLSASLRITASQYDIVPPEKVTYGYTLLNIAFTTNATFISKKHPLFLQLKLNNALNKKVFNHTSFYRLIQVPEPGRNLSLNIIQKF